MDEKRGGIHRNGVPLNFCLYLYPDPGQKIVTVVTFFAKSSKKIGSGEEISPTPPLLVLPAVFQADRARSVRFHGVRTAPESRARAAAAGSGNSSASENGANTFSGGKNTSAGSSGSTVSKTSDSESGTYILNTKTMKFHRPDCTSVEKIKAENKEEYTGKRSKLIEEGYEACKSCKP